MFRVLTVAREYGSGGARIARSVAESLEWNLLDRTLIEQIAHAARVDPDLAQRYDERVDTWLHRIGRRSLWYGAFEGVAAVNGTEFFDAEAMVELGRKLIEEAYSMGNCVIVGRGAQCVLQNREDVLHVFIYAPWRERVARALERTPAAANIEEFIREKERQRADYIRMYFGCNRNDPHLYHMLISSELGEDRVARIILHAVDLGDKSCT